jgi:hypothetical protein
MTCWERRVRFVTTRLTGPGVNRSFETEMPSVEIDAVILVGAGAGVSPPSLPAQPARSAASVPATQIALTLPLAVDMRVSPSGLPWAGEER